MSTSGNATRSNRPAGVLGVCFLLPFLMGGCPEYRGDVAGVFEAAVRTALLGSEDEWTIAGIIRGSITDATIDLVFDQFRGGQQ